MKQFLSFICGIIALSLMMCSHNDLYEDMPAEIQSFVSQYYPNSELSDFTASASSYTVIIKNGPTMVFNSDCKWIKIDGNGSVLPQVFLFNDFPPDLYNYLQETENTKSVFCVSRTTTAYTVQLLDSTLTYNIATGEITGKDDTL